MKEAILEPKESKKSKAGSECAVSIGAMAKNGIQEQLMLGRVCSRRSVRILVFIFYAYMQQSEAVCQERCVTDMVQSERDTMHTYFVQLVTCLYVCKL